MAESIDKNWRSTLKESGGEYSTWLALPNLARVQVSHDIKRTMLRMDHGVFMANHTELLDLFTSGERPDLTEKEALAYLLDGVPDLEPDEKAPGYGGQTARAIAQKLVKATAERARAIAKGTYEESENEKQDRAAAAMRKKGLMELLVRDYSANREGPIKQTQAAAVDHLIQYESKVLESALSALAEEIRPYAKRFWSDLDDRPGARDIYPENMTVAQLRERVTALVVIADDREFEGMGYLELAFKLAWDDEHHTHVVTHADRIIGVFDAGQGWTDKAAKKPATRAGKKKK